jgi:hypothetical protein
MNNSSFVDSYSFYEKIMYMHMETGTTINMESEFNG